MNSNAIVFQTVEASAIASMGEYKPALLTKTGRKAVWSDEVVVKKSTETLGTSLDGINADGSQAFGKFGKYRGVTFATRAEAIEYAAAELVRRQAAQAAWDERQALRRQGVR